MDAEISQVAAWLRARLAEGIEPDEIGMFIRSTSELSRAESAASSANLPYAALDETPEPARGRASICAMHLAKGLEFRAVAVMACDDEVIPLQQRIETATGSEDLEDVYSTERHLLCVACTRARDHLFVTGVPPASEFLDDLKTSV